MKAKKNKRQRSEQMQQVSAGLRDVLGMRAWRKAHPKATWAEIEAAVDEQINQVRVQLLEDLVQMGEGEDWRELPKEHRPTCATCGQPLSARGEQTRWIQTNGGQAIKLTRTYGTCPSCGAGFFPPRWTGKTLLTYREHAKQVNAVTWSPDGRRIASASDDKTVQVWQAE